MAFCNSCGANITPGTRFCNKCGAPVPANTQPVTSTPTPAGSTPTAAYVPPATGAASSPGSSALKIILIVVGVVVLLGILGMASVGFIAWRFARHSHIRQNGDNVKVETPFGSVETTQDAGAAARTIGIDIYPGAKVLKEGSTSMTFGSVHTSTLNAETSDSPEKVCSFYKPRFPNAMVMSSESNQCSIVSNDQKNMVTINAKEEDGKTRIVISNVSKAKAANSPSD
jgi:zinc-ribbon domain